MRYQPGRQPLAAANAGLVAGCGCNAHRAALLARGLLDLTLLLLAEPGLRVYVLASIAPQVPGRGGKDVDVIWVTI
jgi:hypothetical protein